MKAVIVEEPFGTHDVRVVERSEPKPPGPGQLLVRVRAGALNYRDLLVAAGTGRSRPPSGRILGSDACGIVVETGEGVVDFATGDRVLSTILPQWIDGPLAASKVGTSAGGAKADGVFAEYVVLEARSVVRAPVHMTDPEVATLVCAGLTAWQALTKAGSLEAGHTVLVEGTGGVSIYRRESASANLLTTRCWSTLPAARESCVAHRRSALVWLSAARMMFLPCGRKRRYRTHTGRSSERRRIRDR